jgi:hypothetical protein
MIRGICPQGVGQRLDEFTDDLLGSPFDLVCDAFLYTVRPRGGIPLWKFASSKELKDAAY